MNCGKQEMIGTSEEVESRLKMLPRKQFQVLGHDITRSEVGVHKVHDALVRFSGVFKN